MKRQSLSQSLFSQLLSTLFIATVVAVAIAPAAQATTFRFRTLQVRSGETVVIEDNAIGNFRRQQRDASR